MDQASSHAWLVVSACDSLLSSCMSQCISVLLYSPPMHQSTPCMCSLPLHGTCWRVHQLIQAPLYPIHAMHASHAHIPVLHSPLQLALHAWPRFRTIILACCLHRPACIPPHMHASGMQCRVVSPHGAESQHRSCPRQVQMLRHWQNAQVRRPVVCSGGGVVSACTPTVGACSKQRVHSHQPCIVMLGCHADMPSLPHACIGVSFCHKAEQSSPALRAFLP